MAFKRPDDSTIDIIAMLTSVGLFVADARRLAGGVTTANGLYQLHRGRKKYAAANLIVGGSFLLFPEWPNAIVNALKSGSGGDEKKLSSSTTTTKTSEKSSVPVRYEYGPREGTLDRLLDGNWTVLDVRDLRTPQIAARAQSLKPGDVASLVLQYPGAQPVVYNARVIGGSSGTIYQAQWATQAPPGGPQMVEFGQEHVYAVH